MRAVDFVALYNFAPYLICGVVGLLNQFVLLPYIIRSFSSGDWEEWRLLTFIPLLTAAADGVLFQLGLGPIVLAATGISMILGVALFNPRSPRSPGDS